jgi:hypothetical protein
MGPSGLASKTFVNGADIVESLYKHNLTPRVFQHHQPFSVIGGFTRPLCYIRTHPLQSPISVTTALNRVIRTKPLRIL